MAFETVALCIMPNRISRTIRRRLSYDATNDHIRRIHQSLNATESDYPTSPTCQASTDANIQYRLLSGIGRILPTVAYSRRDQSL